MEGEDPDGVPFEDPNKRHLVAEVSRKVSGSQICPLLVMLQNFVSLSG